MSLEFWWMDDHPQIMCMYRVVLPAFNKRCPSSFPHHDGGVEWLCRIRLHILSSEHLQHHGYHPNVNSRLPHRHLWAKVPNNRLVLAVRPRSSKLRPLKQHLPGDILPFRPGCWNGCVHAVRLCCVLLRIHSPDSRRYFNRQSNRLCTHLRLVPVAEHVPDDVPSPHHLWGWSFFSFKGSDSKKERFWTWHCGFGMQKQVTYRETTIWVFLSSNWISKGWNKTCHFASNNDNDSQDRPIIVVHKYVIQSVGPSIAYVICSINKNQIKEIEQGHKCMVLINLPSSGITQSYSIPMISSLIGKSAYGCHISMFQGSTSVQCLSLEMYQTLVLVLSLFFQNNSFFHKQLVVL